MVLALKSSHLDKNRMTLVLLMKPASSSCRNPASLDEDEEEVLRHDKTDDDESVPPLLITIIFPNHIFLIVVAIFLLIHDHFLIAAFLIHFCLCVDNPFLVRGQRAPGFPNCSNCILIGPTTCCSC